MHTFSLTAFADPVSLLFAEGAAPPPSLMGGGMIPMLLVFGIFYFLMIRPTIKGEKDRKKKLAENLKKGERVVLTGGICGRVSSLDDKVAMVEIADKVKIKVLRKDIVDFEADALKSDGKDGGKAETKESAQAPAK